MQTLTAGILVLFTAASLGLAQAPPADPQAQPAPAAPAPPVWSVGPIDFSGLVDGYYNLNFNHPSPAVPSATGIATGGNQLYNFDVNANQFSLNMAKLSLSHSPDPVGFQVDFGFGKAFDVISFNEQAPAIWHNIEQAFVSFKPQKDKGVEIDFGKFVTWAGAEVIESHSNWNYSRSLLFAWAIPYYHFGLRATDTWGHFQGGFAVLNGWNNVEDNNTGKTIGVIGNFSSKKVSWSNTYYTGPENPGTNRGFRNMYDTVLLLTPADKFNAYVNFDYGQNKSFVDKADKKGTTAAWYGVALAAKLQMNGKNALTPRYEWFRDRDGFETGFCDTSKKGRCGPALQEFTLTYEYKWVEGLMARLEYRHDWGDERIYSRGASTNASKNQDTLALGIVAFIGPKR